MPYALCFDLNVPGGEQNSRSFGYNAERHYLLTINPQYSHETTIDRCQLVRNSDSFHVFDGINIEWLGRGASYVFWVTSDGEYTLNANDNSANPPVNGRVSMYKWEDV